MTTSKRWFDWIANWRHVAAYVYMFICLFDFVIMPLITVALNTRLTDAALVALVRTMHPTAQVEALKILHASYSWDPITLKEAGMFHISFGAILGVAAFTRGKEKIERARIDSAADAQGSGGNVQVAGDGK